MNIPRSEYPRPQFCRDEWENLNGLWQFEIDHERSGRERKLYEKQYLSGEILVPFCPESELSGLGYKDFIQAIWYKRRFSLPPSWQHKRIRLHFGAVDYKAEVWINGQSVGIHLGGYSSFSFDITEYLVSSENEITVCAEDNLRCGKQPHGKQSKKLHSYECSYSRTTGIWQTVWLEPVTMEHIENIKLYPDLANECLFIHMNISSFSANMIVCVKAILSGITVGATDAIISSTQLIIRLPLSEIEPWEISSPVLYDLELILYEGGLVLDHVRSYFGMRSIAIFNKKVYINGKPVFQKLVLDQGYYPDGIYTAPNDEAFKKDILLAKTLGFNGARLHQKVFEQRFLYWADHLGYLVWGEYADTGLDLAQEDVLKWILPEWQEIITRDFNSPALITWCPLNETRDNTLGTHLRPDLIRYIFEATKRLDPTRPVIDASGFVHNVTDIFDVHVYEQNPKTFKNMFSKMLKQDHVYNTHPKEQKYRDQPYMVSEYGGTWWSTSEYNDNQMSYGERPRSIEEFMQRFETLTSELLSNPAISGFCYTQLYDVEQEVNGLYTYSRQLKFDADRIRRVLKQKARIEECNDSCGEGTL